MHSHQYVDSSNLYHDESDDVYDEVIQEATQPQVCPNPPGDEEEGEDQLDGADRPTPEPIIPSRLQRQQPSSHGRVAYVIYGGQGSEPGVYYNWSSCSAVIARYHHNSAPPYLGFNAEQDARSSFTDFQATRQLPPGLFFRPLRPLIGPPTPVQSVHPSTPQRRSMTPTSRSTLSPPPQTPIRTASQTRSPFETQPTSSSPSRVRSSPNPSSLLLNQRNAGPAPATAPQPSRPLLAPVAENPLFYVVIEGDAPGVYGLQAAAVRARGLHVSRIIIYTTRETANQAFVDAYMASRVNALPGAGS